MMKILVRGFRGADRAELSLDPIALVAGENGSGKSSVAQAVAAALTGCTIPFFRSAKPDRAIFTKVEAKGLVRGGVDKASVVITGIDGRVTVTWPAHEVTTEGTPPQSSKVAAGLVNPMEMEDADRQKFLSALLECEPKDGDIITACKDAGLHGDRAEEVCQLIMRQGWDPAYKLEREKGAKLKGQGEAAAGTDFGRLKAEAFVPEGWVDDLRETTLAQLEEHVANARQKVENALGALAVDAAEVDRLGQEAIAEKQAQAAVDGFKPTLETADQALRTATATVNAIVIPAIQNCPHCDKPLEVTGGKVKKAVLGTKELQDLERRLGASKHLLTDAGLARDIAGKDMLALQQALGKHSGASVRYEAARGRKGSQEALGVARDLLASLEKRRTALSTKTRADAAYRMILEQVKVVEILAPDGLRRAKLGRALADFNTKTLAPLCAAAGFPPIALNDALDLLYGGRPYYLLSESEKYRARAVLQTAVARLDGSLVVIFDGVDILDTQGREGLFAMIADDQELLFLACATIDPKYDEDGNCTNIPDLEAAEIGMTYLMESGQAQPLFKKLQEA